MKHLKRVFVIAAGLVGLVGAAKNGFQFTQVFYLWPLVRFVGYGSLLVYALLMLRRARYNSASFPEEE